MHYIQISHQLEVSLFFKYCPEQQGLFVGGDETEVVKIEVGRESCLGFKIMVLFRNSLDIYNTAHGALI